LFDFKNANENQRKAIEATEGPVLITAGPGTGKTFTLVQRVIYLIQELEVKPEEIFVATFTEKAAKELITRITNELVDRGITANTNEMYVGTFHSICLRIIKNHLEYTRLKKNYRTLDEFDQRYAVFQAWYRFAAIEDFEMVIADSGAWRGSEEVCKLVNTLSEELVSAEELMQDSNKEIYVLGAILEKYQNLLKEQNYLDFAAIQAEAHRLLTENPEILSSLQEQLKYLMVDEYQDTNYIQEQITLLLAGERQNICVVGDDDQGLYRFRGATIRNILEFPGRFDSCEIISLDINYRSNSDIVEFYNEWMESTAGSNFRFDWGGFRYPKRIRPFEKSSLESPAVIKVSSGGNHEDWYDSILQFIIELLKSEKLTDYNQLAFLFSSVKHEDVQGLAQFLEDNGISVYSPRSKMFFNRPEIIQALGCLMMMFPGYVEKLFEGDFEHLSGVQEEYFLDCADAAKELLEKREGDDDNKELRFWIQKRGLTHQQLKVNTDYGYTGLLYQLLEFEPFRTYVSSDLSCGYVDARPARNLAILTQVIGKYEYLHRVSVLTPEKVEQDTEKLFNLYLKLLYVEGIGEYEDNAEYAPSGCVSFLTIHQSKGMEFPIVFVDSLGSYPRNQLNDLLSAVERKYFKRQAFEPPDSIKFFDFWRKYYTAFSRAQDLLVLTCHETQRKPSKYFKDVFAKLPSNEDASFSLSEFAFHEVKEVNLKNTFSFTSHVTLYERCSWQYKFYKELEFVPVRAAAMLFGMLVHQTIEDIHRAAIRGEEHLINMESIGTWFDANYDTLSRSERHYLAEPQKEAARKQVERYAERNGSDWSRIKETEVGIELVKPDYILSGVVDLIKGEGDTVEVVDFKAERKPDLELDREEVEKNRRQLNIYAHLIEEKTGYKVSKMHIYYTGEESGVPQITYPYSRTAIEGTLASVDSVVKNILAKDFSKVSKSTKLCGNCDFRFYCKK